MKKLLIVTAVLIGMMASAMMLSSFTTPKQNAKAECSKSEMSAPAPWKEFRTNVPYCDGDKGMCVGHGKVWVNTDNYQILFLKANCTSVSCGKDLVDYTGKDGYNMRFWDSDKNQYYYVSIYIPSSAFDY